MDSIFSFLLSFFRGTSFKATLILVYTVFAVTFWKYIPSAEPFADPATGGLLFTATDPTIGDFLWGSRKILGAFLLMGVGPLLIVKFVFRESLADYGLRLGIRHRTFRTMAIYVPVMILLAWLSSGKSSFFSVYPYNPWAGTGRDCFIYHALLYFVFYYSAWEFLFRGFILRGLAPTCGVTNALLVQLVISAMLHFGHPFLEVLGSIGGGLFWGCIALRTNSVFSGWVQHATLGIALDFFILSNIVSF